jgi:hypothetical protein
MCVEALVGDMREKSPFSSVAEEISSGRRHKMRDEIDARLLADHGPELATAVLKWIAELSAAFIRMNERNYAAPWRAGLRRG